MGEIKSKGGQGQLIQNLVGHVKDLKFIQRLKDRKPWKRFQAEITKIYEKERGI